MLLSAQSQTTTYIHDMSNSEDTATLVARLQAENDQLHAFARGILLTYMRRDAAQQAALERQRIERLAERAWFKRPGVAPAYKVTVALALWRMGATFGNPNIERQRDYTDINHGDLAAEVGISVKVIGDYMAAASTPSAEYPIPILRKVTTKKEAFISTGQGDKKKRVLIPKNGYAPADGAHFAKVLTDPLTMPIPTTFKRRAQNATHVATKRAEEKAAVAEAARIIAGMCPSCGSVHVDLRCHTCDTVTPIAAVPAYVPSDGAESAPLPGDAQGADSAPLGASAHADALSAPPLGERKSTRRDGGTEGEGVVSTDHGVPSDGADSAPLGDDRVQEEEDVKYPDAVRDLVAPQHAAALSQAVDTLLSVCAGMPSHVAMQPRATEKANKYLTMHTPLTPRLLAEHLAGTSTLGTGLLVRDEPEMGRRCRAVAYDSDDAFTLLTVAARQLAVHDVTALLVRNRAKPNSGHMWVLFDGEVDPARAFAVLEGWAPGLRTVREKFPSPTVKGGHRLRLPGGCYLPVASDPVPVEVALFGVEDETPQWEDALSPMAWVLIAGAVTPAAAIQHAWLPTDQRPTPHVPPKAPPVHATMAQPTEGSLDAIVARFNREHPISSLVEVNKHGVFHSPWHADTTPSCHRRLDGAREYWVDFSTEQRGGDALALYAALQGFWPRDAAKPDRLGALVHAGYELPKRKEGCTFERRGDELLVRLSISDSAKWERAKESLKHSLAPQYDAAEKAWVLPAARADAVQAWARDFAATERGERAS